MRAAINMRRECRLAGEPTIVPDMSGQLAMKPIGHVIQDGRAQLRLSVDELADRADVPAAAVWALIDSPVAGHARMDPRVIHALAAALEIAPHRLSPASVNDSNRPVLAPDSTPD